MNLTPKQSRTALQRTACDASTRRPLSLQPQPKPPSASTSRISLNQFIAGGSKENVGNDHSSGGRQSLDLTKKRMSSPNNLTLPGHHRRSISLTSDPDDPSYGRAVIPSIPETTPSIPPVPSSAGPAIGSSILPPINLSPPSPPRNISKLPWSPWATQSHELLAPSTPPKGAIQAIANSSL